MDIVGDSIMCLWLADDSAGDACRKACDAALALHRLMNEAPPGDKTALPTRFGLHYGPVFLGEVGADARRELRVVGDIVNTSSRIQSVNKILRTRILAPERCSSNSPRGEDEARLLGSFVLAGKRQAIDLHEIRSSPLPQDAREAFEIARSAYARGALDLARLHLRILLATCPEDGPGHYVERCEARLAGVDFPDGGGCIVLESK
jgi:adenylate cyclase